MDQLEGTMLSPERALADFRALSLTEQMPLIDSVYFAEIKAGGEAYAATKVGYDRSYRAIQALFPGSVIGGTTAAYNGSLSLYQNARIRTEQGGKIGIARWRRHAWDREPAPRSDRPDRYCPSGAADPGRRQHQRLHRSKRCGSAIPRLHRAWRRHHDVVDQWRSQCRQGQADLDRHVSAVDPL
jgi:hypothetical protein